jgi:hypothetical protein
MEVHQFLNMAVPLEQIPETEYRSRLSEWSERAEAQERAHRRMGNWRFLFAVVIVALTAILAQTRVGVGFALSFLFVGCF